MRIYGQYLDTAITFEYTLPTEAEFAARISDILRGYPYLIWEENGAILGYAYAHRAQERQAYQWNAELSVYVEKIACPMASVSGFIARCLHF
ncbi:GNAT family N-acetyltransferase [Yeguia hominis]|uniref:GNAT family N-acetyltransferase n=1 Tax=Yeguia hominis TaxID=2763662 RepID=UPI0020163FF9|nr:GNAT family N-acetyltransferase [Yeguia hominis]